MNGFARLIRDERGATAIEYGLICALIVIAMIVGLNTFANTAIGMWNGVATNVQTHMGA
jgi:pilus assembly protein Flp/PilA